MCACFVDCLVNTACDCKLLNPHNRPMGAAGDQYLLQFGILLPTGKCMSHRCWQHFYLDINISLGWWFKTLHIFSSLSLYSHAYKLGTQPSLHSLFSTHMSKDILGWDVHPTKCAFLVKNDMNWNIKHINRLKDTTLCPTSIPGINCEVHRPCRKQDPDSAVQWWRKSEPTWTNNELWDLHWIYILWRLQSFRTHIRMIQGISP